MVGLGREQLFSLPMSRGDNGSAVSVGWSCSSIGLHVSPLRAQVARDLIWSVTGIMHASRRLPWGTS